MNQYCALWPPHKCYFILSLLRWCTDCPLHLGSYNTRWNWHIANIEYSNAASVDELAAAHWDQDDPYEFPGHHVMLHGGNKCIVDHLARDLQISYNTRVRKIKHGANGCTVECSDGTSYTADAVISTLPLGVMKRGAVDFEPALPDEKVRAIQKLGYGVLNKIMLMFSHQFWDDGVQTFGYCPGEESDRGEAFLFYVYSGTGQGNVLIAIVSGSAAMKQEERTSEESMKRTIEILRRIFNMKGRYVPEPTDYYVTRWYSDEYAGYGSYSFIPVGASGEEYTTLGEPVGERLYFAGESTTRLHPATMHGAFCTGRLAASRVDGTLKRRMRMERLQERNTDTTEWAHKWAPIAQRLEAIFDQPDMTFGAQFAAILDPRPAGEDGELNAPALLKISFLFDKRKKRKQPIFLQLTRGEVLNLLAQGEDHRRLVTLRDKIMKRSGLDYAGLNVLAEVERRRGFRNGSGIVDNNGCTIWSSHGHGT